MSTDEAITLLTSHLRDRSMRGIAIGVAALIRSGALPVGTQLPAVRDLAVALEVSPATVSGAWKQLRSYRMVTGGSRRTGLWVQGDQTALRPVRYEGRGNFGQFAQIDLRLATPDVELLPDLARALVHATGCAELNSYRREVITPALEEAVHAVWPYEARAFIAANGGYDALYLAFVSGVLPGSYVAVEDPATVRTLDILDKVGVRTLPVECDDQGPIPESLVAALERKPAAFLFQPGTHATTGRRLGKERLAALSAVLQHSDALIVEDDGLWAIAPEPAFSLGDTFPERTVHVKSFSKSHGPDLRLGVISGPKKLIDQIRAYRNFRDGWTSRILQNAAAFLLRDEEAIASVQHARQTYIARATALSEALDKRKIPHTAGGLVCWIPVPSEQHALVTLASRGIAVNPGSSCGIRESAHIRVATSRLTDGYEQVADAVLACLHDPSWRGTAEHDY